MNEPRDLLAEAARHAADGRYPEARRLYERLREFDLEPDLRGRIENDLSVVAAAQGHNWSARLHAHRACEQSPDSRLFESNWEAVTQSSDESDRVKVAIVSLLFNWPSTGGGTVHTKELADFLSRDGYDVRHVYAVNETFGVGRATEPLPYAAEPIEFSESDWTAAKIRQRFRAAVDGFAPDWVIVTDSWNTKPLLAEAVRPYPYFLRIAALECLCPLNNVRLLVHDTAPENGNGTTPAKVGLPELQIVQCDRNQLAEPEQCRACVTQHVHTSGGLHQAERALAGFNDDEYPHRLRQAFAEAEGVLVVNPKIAELISPHTPAVHVVPSGFDPLRFPAKYTAPGARNDGKTRILFAGLVHEFMKGFFVLEAAAQKLREYRDDFEIWVTADPDPETPEYFRYVGWQSQEQLTHVIHAADLLVFPTVAQEALGRTAVEAMGCGRPVVASRIGGLDWVVEDERTGLLFEPGDVGGLCRQLERLLDDPALRERLGRAGRDKFECEFTWESILSRHYRPLFGPAWKADLQLECEVSA